MFSRQTLLILVVVAACVAVFSSWGPTTDAQSRDARPFDHVEVFTYASGLTGFFDRDTGTLYVYDSRWDKCVTTRGITKLGSPMVELRKRGR